MRITIFTTVLPGADNLIIRDVPVSSTIIEINDNNLAIIDTGVYNNPELSEYLEEFGYHPHDFDLVINTHLHADHMGGNRLFTNARIIVSRRELDYETALARTLQEKSDPLEALRTMGRRAENGKLLASEVKRLVEEYPVAILVGDPEQLEFMEDDPQLPAAFSLLMVPGHSIDSRAVVIKGKQRRVVAAGDALYHRDLWRTMPIIGFHYDDIMFQRNAERLASLPDIIIPGHDRGFDNISHKYLLEDSFILE